MVSISEAFELARMGGQETAVGLLKGEFERMQSPEQRVELCEWIANCFENLEDFALAGEWYEMAGALSLSETGSPLINALGAMKEYERAQECYASVGDAESADKCCEMINELKRSYAAA